MKMMFFGLILALWSFSAVSQPYQIEWSTIDGGGGASSGGSFSLVGTIGQPDAGMTRAGGYELTGGFWGVVQEFGCPELHIRFIPGKVIISWREIGAACQLQQCPGIPATPGTWQDLLQPTTLVNGERQLILGATAPARFFRLRKP